MIYNPASSGSGGSSHSVTFLNSEWTTSGSDRILTIPKSKHGMADGNFVSCIYCLVNGKYLRNTWAGVCTDVQYDASSGNIVLTNRSAYSGKIVFSI